MTQAERTARHEAAIARFLDEAGPAYAAWLAALPVTHRIPWTPVAANDDLPTPANDNTQLDEAA